MNLIDLIKKKVYQDNIAIVTQNEKISYRELLTLSLRLSSIINNNYGKGKESIGVFLPGSLDYAIAFCGIAASNKVVVPLNINMKKAEFLRQIKYLHIRAVVTNDVYLKKLSELSNDNIDIINVKSNKIQYSKFSSIPLNEYEKEELEDVALILHTSGSFKAPKSVMLSHYNLISCAESIAHNLDVTDKDVTLIVLPMYYASAVIAQFLVHLLVGGTIFFMNNIFTPCNLFYNIEKYNITNFSCVPKMLIDILNDIDKLKEYNFFSLKFVCFGGAAAPGEKINKLVRYFKYVRFIKTYGLTEASTRVAHYIEKADVVNDNCVGISIPNINYKIVDDYGCECEIGKSGEVLVSGPNIMKGYYSCPQETKKAIQDGWLRTGDIGKIDSDFNLYIIGRKKNIIIRNGENIYPEEIEEIIDNYPFVCESFVYGEKHETLGEVPVAKIVVDDNFELQRLLNYCYSCMSNTKIPVRFDIVKYIEKTSNGKKMRLCKK